MNFQHYFAQLQTPVFSFYQFDNQEVIKKYLIEIDEYMVAKKVYSYRKIFNIFVELLQQASKAQYAHFVKIYAMNDDVYVLYAKIDMPEKYKVQYDYLKSFLDEIQHLNREDIIQNYRYEIFKTFADEVTEEISRYHKLGWLDIKRKSNEAYFQLVPPTAPNFTLEIIAVVKSVNLSE